MNEPSEFILTAQDKQSMLWRNLLQHFSKKLAETRAQNDSISLDVAATNEKRGRIAVYKALIALDEDRPVINE